MQIGEADRDGGGDESAHELLQEVQLGDAVGFDGASDLRHAAAAAAELRFAEGAEIDAEQPAEKGRERREARSGRELLLAFGRVEMEGEKSGTGKGKKIKSRIKKNRCFFLSFFF